MVGRYGALILGISVLLTLNDIRVNVSAHSEDEHDDFQKEFGDESVDSSEANSFSVGTEEDHVEVREATGFPKVQPIHVKDLPPLRFLFCVSCGYRQAFDQFSTFVREKYPDMPIEGSNYPPPPWKAYTAQAINLLKMAVIVVIITGSNPMASFGIPTPSVLTWAQSNKLSACMMTFLLSNMVEGSLMGTGAFEIYLGNEQVWSKLESGRVPNPQELMQMIDAQLELIGKLPAGAAGGNFAELPKS